MNYAFRIMLTAVKDKVIPKVQNRRESNLADYNI